MCFIVVSAHSCNRANIFSIIMTGTSPFTFQSPSYQSSSYLPKLEAEFCRDFSCCGLPLPSLHDLLRHYEEHHAQQMPINNENDNQEGNSERDAHDVDRQQSRHPQQQNSGITSPIGGVGSIQYEMMRQQQMQRQRQQEEERGNHQQDDQPEGEIAGDMEMDDDEMTPPPNNIAPPLTPQAHLGQQQHYSLPQTPAALTMPSYHNTPNMASAQPPHVTKQPYFSPESSVPGTPLATDTMEYAFPQGLGGFPNQQQFNTNLNYNTGVETAGEMVLNLCIDEPAKRLYSHGGQALGVYSQAQIQQYMTNNGANDMNKKLLDNGAAQSPTMPAALMQAEDKPFKCPVVGCEKAYKNQNGLKYHKAVGTFAGHMQARLVTDPVQHGHTNQQLHDNADGTFSIVNPETCTPYPGTLGMEKEKPYRCEYCGKRYKNLNGLKYHRSHSTHPYATGLPGSAGMSPMSQQPIPGGVVAVAGGMGDSGMGMP